MHHATFMLIGAAALSLAAPAAAWQDSTAPNPQPSSMTGQMDMGNGAMPHQRMVGGDMMQNCQAMHQQMMGEMQAMRQDMAELRAELRRHK